MIIYPGGEAVDNSRVEEANRKINSVVSDVQLNA
jgi:hypothetical protein